LLFQQGLPRREEHRAADVQADPLPAVPGSGVDPGAVPRASQRRYPATLSRGRRSGSRGCGCGCGCRRRRRAITSLAVFVVVVIVVIVVVVVVVVAAVVCRLLRHTDLR